MQYSRINETGQQSTGDCLCQLMNHSQPRPYSSLKWILLESEIEPGLKKYAEAKLVLG